MTGICRQRNSWQHLGYLAQQCCAPRASSLSCFILAGSKSLEISVAFIYAGAPTQACRRDGRGIYKGFVSQFFAAQGPCKELWKQGCMFGEIIKSSLWEETCIGVSEAPLTRNSLIAACISTGKLSGSNSRATPEQNRYQAKAARHCPLYRAEKKQHRQHRQ